MNIKKDGKHITLIGRNEVVTNFVEGHLIAESIISKTELANNCVEYKVIDNAEESGYIADCLMDFYDDILFGLMVNYNELFQKDIEFDEVEHSGIVIDGRYALLKILNEIKKEQ